MLTIIYLCKRGFAFFRYFLKQVTHLFGKILLLVKRGSFALPQDETERLQVLDIFYKSLTPLLALAVLCAGVWLSEHGYPAWMALTAFALRLLYVLPAKRVERALRKQQYQDRAQYNGSLKRT